MAMINNKTLTIRRGTKAPKLITGLLGSSSGMAFVELIINPSAQPTSAPFIYN